MGTQLPALAGIPQKTPSWGQEGAGAEIPPPLGFGRVQQPPTGHPGPKRQGAWGAAGIPASQWVQPGWDTLPAPGKSYPPDPTRDPLPTAPGRMLWEIWGAGEGQHPAAGLAIPRGYIMGKCPLPLSILRAAPGVLTFGAERRGGARSSRQVPRSPFAPALYASSLALIGPATSRHVTEA